MVGCLHSVVVRTVGGGCTLKGRDQLILFCACLCVSGCVGGWVRAHECSFVIEQEMKASLL